MPGRNARSGEIKQGLACGLWCELRYAGGRQTGGSHHAGDDVAELTLLFEGLVIVLPEVFNGSARRARGAGCVRVG
jgi:hypothetical protein